MSLPRLFLFTALSALLLSTAAVPQPPAKPAPPKLEPVAETRLLMEALNQANFRGLERLLKQKPADVETWTFARGQALLIAETGNLLLMRPPHNSGEAVWMDRATDLRAAATRLARAAADSDYPKSRVAFAAVADACNRCHQSFRVPVRLTPFADPPDRKE
jgi:cytochrome c556